MKFELYNLDKVWVTFSLIKSLFLAAKYICKCYFYVTFL